MIEQWAERSRMVFAPTVYDRAFEAGLTTAEVDWVAVTNGRVLEEFLTPNP